MTRSFRGLTRSEEIYDALRADVLSGRLAPGQRLKSTDLCERYEASVGALREAMVRLVAQGLICNESHVGYSVVPLSSHDLDELTTARVEIEGMVLRRSIEKGDLRWEQGLLAAHHALRRTPTFVETDGHRLSDEWAAVHSDFHHVLLAGCGNDRLLRMASDLRASAELYRQWSTSLGDEHDRDLDGEHRTLCDLALARDSQGAVVALTRHIEHTRDLLNRVLESSG